MDNFGWIHPWRNCPPHLQEVGSWTGCSGGTTADHPTPYAESIHPEGQARGASLAAKLDPERLDIETLWRLGFHKEAKERMGYYIPGPVVGKADFIIREHGAREVSRDEAAKMVATHGVISVEQRGGFHTACFCYNQDEFEMMSRRDDGRIRWLVMDRAVASQLSRLPHSKRQLPDVP